MKEIELSKNGTKYKGMYKALVDNNVFDEVNQYDWHYRSDGYASRNDYSTGKQKTIYLHRYIWNLKVGDIPKGLDVEHWDENKLNCQLSNLRLATRSENRCNVSKRKDNKSGVKGICKVVKKGQYKDKIYTYTKWRAEIRKDYRKKN